MRFCKATTRDGTSCSRAVWRKDDEYCWQHRNKVERDDNELKYRREIESQIQLIRNQIGILQVAAGKKRRFYVTLSVVISGLALLLSIIATTYSILADKENRLRQDKDEIRTLLSEVIELQSNIDEEAVRGSVFYREKAKKIEVYLAAISDLTRDLPSELSYHEYIVLAEIYSRWENYVEVESYLSHALKLSRQRTDSAFVYYLLGDNYFSLVKSKSLSDYKPGESKFLKAISLYLRSDGNSELDHYEVIKCYLRLGENYYNVRSDKVIMEAFLFNAFQSHQLLRDEDLIKRSENLFINAITKMGWSNGQFQSWATKNNINIESIIARRIEN